MELKSVSIMFSGSRLILWWLARTLTDADAEHIINDAAEVPFSCYLFGNLCAINCRRFHEYIFSVRVSYQNHRAEAIKVFITFSCTLWNRCIKPGKWHKIATILSLFFLVLVSVFVQLGRQWGRIPVYANHQVICIMQPLIFSPLEKLLR